MSKLYKRDNVIKGLVGGITGTIMYLSGSEMEKYNEDWPKPDDKMDRFIDRMFIDVTKYGGISLIATGCLRIVVACAVDEILDGVLYYIPEGTTIGITKTKVQ